MHSLAWLDTNIIKLWQLITAIGAMLCCELTMQRPFASWAALYKESLWIWETVHNQQIFVLSCQASFTAPCRIASIQNSIRNTGHSGNNNICCSRRHNDDIIRKKRDNPVMQKVQLPFCTTAHKARSCRWTIHNCCYMTVLTRAAYKWHEAMQRRARGVLCISYCKMSCACEDLHNTQLDK